MSGIHLELLNADQPYICCLSSDVLLKSQKELHEKPEWRLRDLEELRKMVAEKSNLKACTSDAFLLRFMRAKKFDYDQALSLLLKYYNVRNTHKEVFREFFPSATLALLRETGNWTNFLNATDYHGRRLLFIDLGNWKPDRITTDQIIRVLLLLLEKELCNEYSQVFGISVIVDVRGLSTPQILHHLKPAVLKKISTCLQGAFPIRLKGIHLVHESTLLDVIMAIVKPFLTEKLRERLYFHGGNAASLGTHMDLEQLPESVGGSSKDPFDLKFMEQLEASDAYFEQLNQYGFLSSAVVEAAEETSPFRSVFHSYKKICIDGLNN